MANRQALRFAYFLLILIFSGSLEKEEERKQECPFQVIKQEFLLFTIFYRQVELYRIFFLNHLIKTGL
jgi:hypothetical protein